MFWLSMLIPFGFVFRYVVSMCVTLALFGPGLG